jgi:hypothetical protein
MTSTSILTLNPKRLAVCEEQQTISEPVTGPHNRLDDDAIVHLYSPTAAGWRCEGAMELRFARWLAARRAGWEVHPISPSRSRMAMRGAGL